MSRGSPPWSKDAVKRYRDRVEAGQAVARALAERGYSRPVVLGIPRGGVIVAAEVALALDGELGVVVARKLRAPDQPELAIGAVTSDGSAWIDASLAEEVGADERYIEREQAAQVEEARHREAVFDGKLRPTVAARVVIIVDDGIATGSTAIAAARSMRAAGAAKVVLAVPVSPPQTLEVMRGEVDDVVCPRVEPDFHAIGEFYTDFRQVSDEEVKTVLDRFAARARTRIRRSERPFV